MSDGVPSVCIIGSSFIGAVFVAYLRDRAAFAGVELNFFAASFASIPGVDVKDGELINAEARNARTSCIGSYDAVFLYGSFPTPYEVSLTYLRLGAANYSEQVRRATILDMIKASRSWQIRENIAKATAVPVYLLSANIPTNGKAHPEVYRFGVELITEAVGPEVYHPFPKELFDDRAAPRPELYKGSLNKEGVRPDNNPDHDYRHMNEQGGAIVLQSIVRRVLRTPTE